MKKAASIPALALALAGSACLAPADDASETAPTEPEHIEEAFTTNNPGLGPEPAIADEPVGQSADALISTNRHPSKWPRWTPNPEALEWAEAHLPRWNLYIGGNGQDLHPGKSPWNDFTNVYYDDPTDSDLFAPVIAIRMGDENEPSKWIQLSLTQAWRKGTRYFDELIACGTLTMTDLVIILDKMNGYADSYIRPDSIRTLTAATREALRDLRHRSRTTCKDTRFGTKVVGREPVSGPVFAESEGPQGPLPPGWVQGPDTQTYGPGAGPLPPIDAGGHVLLPQDPNSDRPSEAETPPNPAPPRAAWANGMGPNDPKPKPSPHDQFYVPRPGEQKEVFKCLGEVVEGYREACPALGNRDIFWKWHHIGNLWVAGQAATIHEWWAKEFWPSFVRANFNGGKNPGCMQNCNHISNNLCGMGAFYVGLILAGLTRGKAFGTVSGGVLTFAGGSWIYTKCTDTIRDYCASDICTK